MIDRENRQIIMSRHSFAQYILYLPMHIMYTHDEYLNDVSNCHAEIDCHQNTIYSMYIYVYIYGIQYVQYYYV